MSDIQLSISLEKIVCNTLALLRYPPNDFPKEMKIALDPDTFKKYFPLRSNTKALESILYFIFSKLCPSSPNLFIFSWPPRTADMKREFKEESYKLIQKLEQENRIPENSLVGKSVLDSAQGERVWALLKVLTDACLRQEVSVPHFPNLAPWVQNPSLAVRSSVYRMKKALIIHISNYAQDFNKKAAKLQALQETWSKHAKDLSSEHTELRNIYDNLINKKKKTDPHQAMQEKLAALDRVPQIDMLKYIWKNIDVLSKAKSESDSIQKVIQESFCKRLVCGDVNARLIAWQDKIINLKQASLIKTSSFSPFVSKLQQILNKYKEFQTQELNSLQQSHTYLQDSLNKNC